MADTNVVYVKLSQKMAAQALVEYGAATGRPASSKIERIANAERVVVDGTVRYVAR